MLMLLLASLISVAGLGAVIAAATWLFEPTCCKDRHQPQRPPSGG